MSHKDDLESVLEYLINEETDQASSLLHKIVVEKARDFYEELVDEEDDVVEEDTDIEEEEVDESFGGDKKRKFAGDIRSDMDEIQSDEIYDDQAEPEMDMDSDMEMDGEMDMEMDGEMDMDMELGAEEASDEEQIADLTMQLGDLLAQFQEITGVVDGAEDAVAANDDEFGAPDDMGGEVAPEFGAEPENESYYEAEESEDEVVEEATKLQDQVTDPSMKKETDADSQPSPIARQPRKDYGGKPHKTGADGTGKASSLHSQTSKKDDGFGAKDNIDVTHTKGPVVNNSDEMDKSTDSTLNKVSDRQK